jgi:hypothetical protein
MFASNARRHSTLSDESDGVELDDHASKEEKPLLKANALQNTVSMALVLKASSVLMTK